MLWIEVEERLLDSVFGHRGAQGGDAASELAVGKSVANALAVANDFCVFHCRRIFCEVEARFAPAENYDFRIMAARWRAISFSGRVFIKWKNGKQNMAMACQNLERFDGENIPRRADSVHALAYACLRAGRLVDRQSVGSRGFFSAFAGDFCFLRRLSFARRCYTCGGDTNRISAVFLVGSPNWMWGRFAPSPNPTKR